MPNIISRETFDAGDTQAKLGIIYDMLSETNRIIADHVEEQKITCAEKSAHCDSRFKKIEQRRKTDASIAAGSGVVGGFVAVVAKLKFFGG